MNRKQILVLSTVLFLGLTLISVLGFVFNKRTLSGELLSGKPVVFQIVFGGMIGFLVSGTGLVLTFRIRWFQGYREILRKVILEIRPKWWDLIYVSVGAGWSEELFFRALLQPLLGIWSASLLFCLAHGMVSLRNWKVNLYGLAVFLAGMGLGTLYDQVGLISAIVAHTSLDLTSLLGFHFLIQRDHSSSHSRILSAEGLPEDDRSTDEKNEKKERIK